MRFLTIGLERHMKLPYQCSAVFSAPLVLIQANKSYKGRHSCLCHIIVKVNNTKSRGSEWELRDIQIPGL